jgi:glucokinase
VKPLILALDIGGTKLACGVADIEGRLKSRAAEPTDQHASPREIFERLVALSQTAINDSGSGPKDIVAVGISYGGPVAYDAGTTITCHHLSGWEDIPLKEWARERFGLPVEMDNDANVAALGEAVYGAGKGHPCLLYLTVSSGIGGGVILGGKIHRGVSSLAGEIGHTVLEPNGPVCTCGKRGCLEALASGWSIARRAKEALQSPAEQALSGQTSKRSLLSNLPPDDVTAQAVAQAAEAGDALALSIINETAGYLGRGIAAGINILNPSIVVIGGGVSKAGDILFTPLRAAVEKYAVEGIAKAAAIVPAALGDDAAILGAAALSSQSLNLPPNL